jgi:hypothetical protein
MTPRPALALVLAFPTPSDYDEKLEAQARTKSDRNEDMNGANVVWYKQTINNACGLSAILHAACNGDARDSIREWNILKRPSKMKIKLNIQKSCSRGIVISSQDASVTVHQVHTDLFTNWLP